MADNFNNDALAATRDYFDQPEPRFWHWGDDAISWSDGATIVFFQELADIFRRLAIDGAPRCTPLLLLLSACRENYRRQRIEHVLIEEKAYLAANASRLSEASDALLDELDRVAALPKELRSTIEAKVALIETVFPGQRLFPVEYALAALELLRTMPAEELLGSGPARSAHDARIWKKEDLVGDPRNPRPHVTYALLVMRHGLRHIDPDALRLRLRTGLDQLVESADTQPPEEESLRSLISRLRNDHELSGLGRLAHDLMAAVQVPRAVSEPDELALGGVSDIANRGPLDRLLTSELAHDDLTLAVRVAVGEALYLRREAPPRAPVAQRRVLIDCGIRLWGVPRLFAAAAGLALAATADHHTHVACWRATALSIEPVDLGTREGLIQLLEQLEAAPHPATALAALFETAECGSAACDTILVTHEDVLNDPAFRRRLAERVDEQFYIVAVDRSGRLQMLSRSGRGTKKIREAQLDIERILAPSSRPTAPVIRRDSDSDLPVILFSQPFPLFLPHQVDRDQMAYHPDFGAVTATHDGRLMHWRRPAVGAAELTAFVPAGHVRHLSIDDGGIVRMVISGPSNGPLTLMWVSLASGESGLSVIDPKLERSSEMLLHQSTLFAISASAIRVINDQGHISPACVPTQRHKRGRFFSMGWRSWFALTFDGHAPQLTRVPLHESINPSWIIAMFDMRGHDGPWAITNEGRIASATSGAILWPGWPGQKAEVLKISECGRHVVLACGNDRIASHLSLDPQRSTVWTSCPKNAAIALVASPELRRLVQSGNLRNQFRQIGTDGHGRLALLSSSKRCVFIGGSNERGVSAVDFSGHQLLKLQSFQSGKGPANVRYHLRCARWPDGSRAWLDSRGLLHLKSNDRDLPELTIVLVQSGQLAAWASDGRVWGPTFYTGLEPDAVSRGEDLSVLIEAFIARLS